MTSTDIQSLIYLFISERERERERMCWNGGGGRRADGEREGERLSHGLHAECGAQPGAVSWTLRC